MSRRRLFWDEMGATYIGWGIATALTTLALTGALGVLGSHLQSGVRGVTSLAVGTAYLLIWGFLGGLTVRPKGVWGTALFIALVTDLGLILGVDVAEAAMPCPDDCSNGYAIGLMAIGAASYVPILLAAVAGKALARRQAFVA